MLLALKSILPLLVYLKWASVRDYPYLDLPDAKEELVACYKIKCSGIKFGLFNVTSYLNILISSLFITVLYLGCWNLSMHFSSLLIGSLRLLVDWH